VTPLGVFTEFDIPTHFSNPAEIVAGPDGAMWFTEQEPISQVGRITISGSVREIALPAPTSRPVGITVGRDGNIWFTEASANRIGRISAAGSTLPVPGLSAVGLLVLTIALALSALSFLRG
jgi:virginiamycin B lyase